MKKIAIIGALLLLGACKNMSLEHRELPITVSDADGVKLVHVSETPPIRANML